MPEKHTRDTKKRRRNMSWQQADKEKIMDQLQAWTVGINDKNTGAKGGLSYLSKYVTFLHVIISTFF